MVRVPPVVLDELPADSDNYGLINGKLCYFVKLFTSKIGFFEKLFLNYYRLNELIYEEFDVFVKQSKSSHVHIM